jgi:hypothetical protein
MPSSSSRAGLAPVTSWPSKTTRPCRIGSRPKIALNTVDLPAPLGPITVVIAPRATSKVVPLRIVTLP